MKEQKRGDTNFLAHVPSADRATYLSCFRRAQSLRPFFDVGIEGIFDTLDQMGVPSEVKGAVLTRLARAHIYLPYHPEYSTLFSQMNMIVQSLRDTNLPFDEVAATILVGSARQEDLFLRIPNYPDKVAKAIASYAIGIRSEAKTIVGNSDQAVSLTEEDRENIGTSIVQVIAKNTSELEVSPNSGEITIQEGDRQSNAFAQILLSEKGVEYAQVGNLFFVNANNRELLPSWIAELGNVIFIGNIEESEFVSSLGYYTLNTLTALMQDDLREKVVLDCGTGTGLLAIAAKRLGAKGVVAVERNPEVVKAAMSNAYENGYADDPMFKLIVGDLRQLGQVLPHFDTFSPGQVTIISNIGSWGDYTITNTTAHAYIPAIQVRSGWSIASVISGGYNNLPTRPSTSEVSFLRRIGLSLPKEAKKAKEWDEQVLGKLGFIPKARALSEELWLRRSAIHQATSFLAIRQAVGA